MRHLLKKPVSKKLAFYVRVKGEGKNPINTKALCHFFANQNHIFTDANGIQLESIEISDVVELTTGQYITDVETGRAASGLYTLPDGSKLIIEAGYLKKIIGPK